MLMNNVMPDYTFNHKLFFHPNQEKCSIFTKTYQSYHHTCVFSPHYDCLTQTKAHREVVQPDNNQVLAEHLNLFSLIVAECHIQSHAIIQKLQTMFLSHAETAKPAITKNTVQFLNKDKNTTYVKYIQSYLSRTRILTSKCDVCIHQTTNISLVTVILLEEM